MKPTFIDSHAHLDFDQYDADRVEMLERAKAAGIGNILQIAMGPSDEKIARCYSLVEQYDYMRMAVGLHPHDADHYTQQVHDLIAAYTSKPRVNAIGEIGLDYYYENSNRENQKSCFSKLMDLAIEKISQFACTLEMHLTTRTLLQKKKIFSEKQVVSFTVLQELKNKR
jgi:TatD DNase family protein